MNSLTQAEAKQAMKPIIFSTPMVRAILAGRKTQTRRIMKPQLKDCSEVHEQCKEADWKNEPLTWSTIALKYGKAYCAWCGNGIEYSKDHGGIQCPYGKEGDILYVRETWVRACLSEDGEGPVDGESWKYWYRADDEWTKHDWHDPNVDGPVAEPKWKPSIHMPRAAARLFLKITGISVERLQDITEEDAIAEGVEKSFAYEYDTPDGLASASTYRAGFKRIWGNINCENSWEQNPWVWKISFERIENHTP